MENRKTFFVVVRGAWDVHHAVENFACGTHATCLFNTFDEARKALPEIIAEDYESDFETREELDAFVASNMCREEGNPVWVNEDEGLVTKYEIHEVTLQPDIREKVTESVRNLIRKYGSCGSVKLTKVCTDNGLSLQGRPIASIVEDYHDANNFRVFYSDGNRDYDLLDRFDQEKTLDFLKKASAALDKL